MSGQALLVLGATGMLGRAAVHRLRVPLPGWRIDGTTRDGSAGLAFEVTHAAPETALARILDQGRYRWILNAIGVLQSAIDETNPASVAQAIEVNARFPHLLAAVTASRGCRVLHVSTDAVFSGVIADPRFEDAPIDPVGVYAMTKALGESTAPHVLNIRCSIVGRTPGGKGLAEWYLRTSSDDTVNGFTDYVWTPTTVPQLIAFAAAIAANHELFETLRRDGPVIHFAPNPPLSKHEFLTRLREASQRGSHIRPATSPGGPCHRVLATRRTHPHAHATAGWPEVLRELVSNEIGVHDA